MIYTDEQHAVSTQALVKLSDALNAAIANKDVDKNDECFQNSQIGALKSQISEISSDLERYMNLKNGTAMPCKFDSLESLPKALIESRIASGMSQDDLALALEVDKIVIQRFEDSQYLDTSLYMLLRVSDILRVGDFQRFLVTFNSAAVAWNNGIPTRAGRVGERSTYKSDSSCYLLAGRRSVWAREMCFKFGPCIKPIPKDALHSASERRALQRSNRPT